MKQKIAYIILALGATFFTGCGSSKKEIATGTSFYIDSAVSGVKYICGGQEGITGEDGSFTFEVGASCTFYLGDLELRKVDASLLKDGQELHETDVKIARILQSMDADGNPSNGITIPANIVDALAKEGITSLPTTTEELDVLLAVVANNGGTEVTEADAKAHLDETAGVNKEETPAKDDGGQKETPAKDGGSQGGKTTPSPAVSSNPTPTISRLETLIVGKTFYAVGRDGATVSSLIFNADGSATFFGNTGSYSIANDILTINDPTDPNGPFDLSNFQELSSGIVFTDSTGNETGILYFTDVAALQFAGMPSTTLEAQNAILGTWYGNCSVDIDRSESYTATYEANATVTFTTYLYSDTICSNLTNTFTEIDTYIIGAKTVATDGSIAFEIDYTDVSSNKAYTTIKFGLNSYYYATRIYSASSSPSSRNYNVFATNPYHR